ncbi:MAG TPA: glycosyltransferase [Actinomycetota bacterium]|nr:glycosyltransferase [Actinomycetota bacterium]
MKVSLISTVKDAAPQVRRFLASVRGQTRPPEEVIVVDGGSTDGTLEVLREAEGITLIEEPGANIARGRNIAAAAAAHEVIAVTDADCTLAPAWLACLVDVIDWGADVAMGSYRPLVRNFFEACVAAATVPEPDEIGEERFMPSSRSIAFRREVLDDAGGYPEWLDVGEDMYLNHRLRERGVEMRLSREAVAYWPMRGDLQAVWRQYFRYARGDALGGMYPERHVIRFAVYGTAAAAAAALPRRRWPALVTAAGALAYSSRRLRRALHLLPDPIDRAKAVIAVPALLGFIDAAKMAGYASGLRERRSSPPASCA